MPSVSITPVICDTNYRGYFIEGYNKTLGCFVGYRSTTTYSEWIHLDTSYNALAVFPVAGQSYLGLYAVKRLDDTTYVAVGSAFTSDTSHIFYNDSVNQTVCASVVLLNQYGVKRKAAPIGYADATNYYTNSILINYTNGDIYILGATRDTSNYFSLAEPQMPAWSKPFAIRYDRYLNRRYTHVFYDTLDVEELILGQVAPNGDLLIPLETFTISNDNLQDKPPFDSDTFRNPNANEAQFINVLASLDSLGQLKAYRAFGGFDSLNSAAAAVNAVWHDGYWLSLVVAENVVTQVCDFNSGVAPRALFSLIAYDDLLALQKIYTVGTACMFSDNCLLSLINCKFDMENDSIAVIYGEVSGSDLPNGIFGDAHGESFIATDFFILKYNLRSEQVVAFFRSKQAVPTVAQPIFAAAATTHVKLPITDGIYHNTYHIGVHPSSFQLPHVIAPNCTITNKDLRGIIFKEQPWLLNAPKLTRKLGIELYPIPTYNNTVYLTVPYELQGATMQVFNMQGQMVHTSRLIGGKQAMHLGNLSPGQYMYRAMHGNLYDVGKVELR
jgi:hypothetical protein